MQDPFAQYAAKPDDPFAAYAAKAPEISSPSAEDMLTRRVGTNHPEADPADWKTPLIESMQSIAHPQSVKDVASYLIPSAVPPIIGRLVMPVARGVAKYGGAALEVGKSLLPDKAQTAIRVLGELKPSEWHSPLTVGGREARAAEAARAFNEAPITQQMDQLPQTPAPERGRISGPPPRAETPFPDRPLYQQMDQLPQTPAPIRGRTTEPPLRNLGRETQPAPPPPPAPSPTSGAAPSTLSPTDRAGLQKQGYPPDVIARIESRLGQPPMRGTLRMAPETPQPMPSHEVSPLREPRINVGAEQVGRQEGLTKEAVRQTTGPVLDEAHGEASPIFPKEALTRIVDDMRALPPGAEREAYVARATSGKAKWQVENIRRTLEHLGLLVPFAAAVRERVQQRLMPSHAPSGAQ